MRRLNATSSGGWAELRPHGWWSVARRRPFSGPPTISHGSSLRSLQTETRHTAARVPNVLHSVALPLPATEGASSCLSTKPSPTESRRSAPSAARGCPQHGSRHPQFPAESPFSMNRGQIRWCSVPPSPLDILLQLLSEAMRRVVPSSLERASPPSPMPAGPMPPDESRFDHVVEPAQVLPHSQSAARHRMGNNTMTIAFSRVFVEHLRAVRGTRRAAQMANHDIISSRQPLYSISSLDSSSTERHRTQGGQIHATNIDQDSANERTVGRATTPPRVACGFQQPETALPSHTPTNPERDVVRRCLTCDGNGRGCGQPVLDEPCRATGWNFESSVVVRAGAASRGPRGPPSAFRPCRRADARWRGSGGMRGETQWDIAKGNCA